jgi:hypothetical protein
MSVVWAVQSLYWGVGLGYGAQSSKVYVLKPKADRRKDWEEKAQTGHFIAYSAADKQGWTVWLPEYDKTVTSVHVLFDEQPPARPQENYEEFDNSIVREVGETRRLEDYLYLVNTHHTNKYTPQA